MLISSECMERHYLYTRKSSEAETEGNPNNIFPVEYTPISVHY